MIPPLAQVKALLAGFRVQAVHAVDVITPNRIREDHQQIAGRIPAFERIIGDHIEAIHHLLEVKGERGGFTDGDRHLAVLNQLRGGHGDGQ